jgi:Sigma-70, region 4
MGTPDCASLFPEVCEHGLLALARRLLERDTETRISKRYWPTGLRIRGLGESIALARCPWEASSWRASRRREPFLEDKPHPRRDSASGEPLDWQELLPARGDTELAVEARELLRALAGLRWHQRTVVTLQLAGYSYKEIAQRLGRTYTWVNRHLTEGRAELRRRQARELEAERGANQNSPRLARTSADSLNAALGRAWR